MSIFMILRCIKVWIIMRIFFYNGLGIVIHEQEFLAIIIISTNATILSCLFNIYIYICLPLTPKVYQNDHNYDIYLLASRLWMSLHLARN